MRHLLASLLGLLQERPPERRESLRDEERDDLSLPVLACRGVPRGRLQTGGLSEGLVVHPGNLAAFRRNLASLCDHREGRVCLLCRDAEAVAFMVSAHGAVRVLPTS